MKNQQHIVQKDEGNHLQENGLREAYSAPQLKVHGKLERLTLQTTSIVDGTGNTPVDPGGGDD